MGEGKKDVATKVLQCKILSMPRCCTLGYCVLSPNITYLNQRAHHIVRTPSDVQGIHYEVKKFHVEYVRLTRL